MADKKDVSIIIKAVDQITAPLQDINAKLSNFSSSVSGLFKALTAGFVSIGIERFLRGSIDAFLESEKSVDRLKTAVGGLGIAYDQVSPAIEDTLTKLMATTRFSDEDGREALTRLVTMTGNFTQSLNDLGLVADVAAYKQITMADAGEIVGKVHAGNVKVLKEFGINALGAADGMTQLTLVTHGFAVDEGKTLGGQLDILKNQWDELKEAVGRAVAGQDVMAGSVGSLATKIADLGQWVAEHGEQLGNFAKFAIGVAQATGNILGTVADGFQRIGERLHLVEVEGTQVIVREETARSRKVQALIAADGKERERLTKQQLKAQEELTKKASADAIAAVTKSHANLAALDKEADKAQLELLSATQKQYEELTRTFQEKMQGMTKDDQAKAAQLLTEAQAALLLKWSNLYKEVVPTVAHGETDVRRELVGTQGYLEAIKVAINEYSGGVDEGAARSILFKLKVADLGGTFKAASETMKNATHDLTGVLDKELLGKVDAIATAIGGLGDAMTKISTGDYLGGVTQGIGALVALGHTIFGGSNELKQQFQANTRRLEELRTTMGDLVHAMSPGRVVSAVAGLNLSGFKPTRPRFSEGEFNRWLIGQGITPAELNQLAKDLNMPIRDSAGNLNLDMLGLLITGAGGADTGIGKDFKSKTTNIDEQISAGLLAPGQRFGALVGAGGDNAISSALSGLDPKDPAFRDKAIGKLQQIFSDLSSGKLGAADWGGLSRSDFHDLLMQLLGILTSGQEITGGWSAPIGRNPGGGGVSIPPPTLPGGLTIPPPISFSNFLGDGSPVITVLDQIQANTAALLGPRAGGAGAVAGAINASIGDIVINGGTVDAATLATLQSTLQVAQDRQLKAFEQALARNFDLSRAGAGNASRAAA